jgi:hypothetical protein
MHTEWTPDLEAALAEPFADELHKTLTKGGTAITFVSVWDYVRRLNDLVGDSGWQNQVTLHDAGGRLIATVSLTILGITKTNVGDEAEEKEGYGTAATNAWAQGLKRAASMFGLGLYLYDKKGRAAAKPKPQRGGQPTAKKPSTQPSPAKQRGPEGIFPSGHYEGKHVSEVPEAYLLTKLDDLAKRKSQDSLRWQNWIRDELDRRHENKQRADTD